jgi:hypothetical protein
MTPCKSLRDCKYEDWDKFAVFIIRVKIKHTEDGDIQLPRNDSNNRTKKQMPIIKKLEYCGLF